MKNLFLVIQTGLTALLLAPLTALHAAETTATNSVETNLTARLPTPSPAQGIQQEKEINFRPPRRP